MIALQTAPQALPADAAARHPAATGADSMAEPVSWSLRWACLFFTAGVLLLLVDGSWRMGFIQRAQIIQIGDTEAFAQPDWRILPFASRLLAMGAWALILAASSIALLGGAHRALPRRCLVMYGGMWFVAGYLLIGFTTDPWETLLTSRGLFGKMAPGTLLGLGVFFLAAHPGAWSALTKKLLFLTAAACVVWLAFACQMTRPSRAEAYRWIFEPTLLLEVVALLPLGFIAGRGITRTAARFGPIVLLALATVLLQARLLFIVLLILILTYGFLRWRAGALMNAGLRLRTWGILVVGLPLLMLIVAIAWPLAEGTVLGGSAQKFWDRRAEDTRTGQIKPFFEKATPIKLLLGAGYPGKDEFNGEAPWPAGIDMGYLNTMYVTGLPMVLLLAGLLIAPVLGCLRLRLAPADAAVVATALAYSVRLASSTVPALSAQFLVACVLMGRCAWLWHAAQREWPHAALDGDDA